MTIANPVALYIRDLDASGFTTPDSSDAKQYWKMPFHDLQAAINSAKGSSGSGMARWSWRAR